MLTRTHGQRLKTLRRLWPSITTTKPKIRTPLSIARCASSTNPTKTKPAQETLLYPDSSSPHHSNLTTFLAYATRTGLNPLSTVYRGTHYEYTVSQALMKYGFALKRIGGASDYGTDLLGTWQPPTTPLYLRTLIQCKAGAQSVGPQHIRELEGTFIGAPAGWKGSGVMGLLVAEKTATKGLRDALIRSKWPMGFLSCSKDGVIRQMLWNSKAAEEGLEGFAAIARRGTDNGEELVLSLNGKMIPFADGKNA